MIGEGQGVEEASLSLSGVFVIGNCPQPPCTETLGKSSSATSTSVTACHTAGLTARTFSSRLQSLSDLGGPPSGGPPSGPSPAHSPLLSSSPDLPKSLSWTGDLPPPAAASKPSRSWLQESPQPLLYPLTTFRTQSSQARERWPRQRQPERGWYMTLFLTCVCTGRSPCGRHCT